MYDEKLASLRVLLDKQDCDGILLTLQKNVSWLSGGRTHINIASESACCNFLITREDCVLIVNNIESERLMGEEFADEFKPLVTSTQIWDWYNSQQKDPLALSLLPKSSVLKTDLECEADLLLLRSVIPEEKKSTLRELGQLTAEAIEQAAMDVCQGDTEYKIAGKLAYRCYERELDPIVNLVAVDERIYSRRHPQPTPAMLQSYAMLVVCARQNGLILSATRLVHFGKPSNELLHKMTAVADIDARIIEATRPGKSLRELYHNLQQFYADAGYMNEYRMHHQGGLTGYATREKLAAPDMDFIVEIDQTYAWNPSISGVKSEDTVLTTMTGPELITESGNYPMREVRVGDVVYKRPDILVR